MTHLHDPVLRLFRWPAIALACAGALGLGGCGGGADEGPAGGGTLPPQGVGLAARVAAATQTAQSEGNDCAPLRPFYWEVGDAQGRLGGASVTGPGQTAVSDDTVMAIASASKWLYGAYVVQWRHGQPSDDDVKFLTFRSGYTHFSRCLPGQTVDACEAYANNGVYSPAADGLFSYGGGHMEKHASLIGLGAADNAALAVAVQGQLGSDVALWYAQPQLAGGVVTSAASYAVFLRKVLSGQLLMKAALGTHAVCTNPATCAQALNAPVPRTESFHYSIGHWVEDDPVDGDGAFSSAGAFGFYPWIDASEHWYGILARHDVSGITNPDAPDSGGQGYASLRCGRLIRAAWIDGVAR